MSAFRLLQLFGTFGSLLTATNAAYDIAFESDDDLSRYITVRLIPICSHSSSALTCVVQRPEIKAPLFEVEIYEPEQVTPGYWFVAPYANIIQERHADRYYQACQSGPAIYDGNGVSRQPQSLPSQKKS